MCMHSPSCYARILAAYINVALPYSSKLGIQNILSGENIDGLGIYTEGNQKC